MFLICRNPRLRIGEPVVRFDTEKVIAVVESRMPDNGLPLKAPDETDIRIAEHILEFFEREVDYGRLPANLLPIQSGGIDSCWTGFEGVRRRGGGCPLTSCLYSLEVSIAVGPVLREKGGGEGKEGNGGDSGNNGYLTTMETMLREWLTASRCIVMHAARILIRVVSCWVTTIGP